MLQNVGKQLRHGSPASKHHRGLLGRRQSRKASRVQVVVPTLRQVRSNARRLERERDTRSTPGEHASEAQPPPPPPPQIKSEASQDAKMYFLLQATIKVEVKPEESISQPVVRDRLARIGYETFDLDVPRDIRVDATATRAFTSRIWGGSMQTTFPRIGNRFTHGLDDFMYVSLLYDPHAPRWPGSPGLLFRFRDDGRAWPKTMRVIVRLRRNAWQYMGQYELTAAPPLTLEEWNAQSVQVKYKWADKLSKWKLDGGLKAKIVLWKRLGRVPTPQEVAAALQSNERFHASAHEILRACDEGRVVVHVWCMKCVGYDVDFQRRIAAGS
ncbi:hypothetical protein V8E55_003808 [Tylopilus felleus]